MPNRAAARNYSLPNETAGHPNYPQKGVESSNLSLSAIDFKGVPVRVCLKYALRVEFLRSVSFQPFIFRVLSTPQCSSGLSQSRPFPARPVKIMESAGHYRTGTPRPAAVWSGKGQNEQAKSPVAVRPGSISNYQLSCGIEFEEFPGFIRPSSAVRLRVPLPISAAGLASRLIAGWTGALLRALLAILHAQSIPRLVLLGEYPLMTSKGTK